MVQSAGIQCAQLTKAEPASWGLPGLSRQPRIYADFDEAAMGINLSQMRIRMHYWLSQGPRVFGVSMGLRADREDDRIYPVHPSRYCINLCEDERSALHCTLPGGHVGFMWQVVLDGVGFLLEAQWRADTWTRCRIAGWCGRIG